MFIVPSANLLSAPNENQAIKTNQMRSARGFKLVKKRDYSSRPSLTQLMEEAPTWAAATKLLKEITEAPGVNGKTIKRCLRIFERRKEGLLKELQARQLEEQLRERKARFYAKNPNEPEPNKPQM